MKGYINSAIAITVEGANILTRSLIIFGQGALRCHPYLLTEMRLAQAIPDKDTVAKFDKVLFSHIKSLIGNMFRSYFHYITRGIFAKTS